MKKLMILTLAIVMTLASCHEEHGTTRSGDRACNVDEVTYRDSIHHEIILVIGKGVFHLPECKYCNGKD